MAKILVFRYDCGWQREVQMLPEQTATELRARFWPRFTRLHRRTCRVCFGRAERHSDALPPDPSVPTPIPNW